MNSEECVKQIGQCYIHKVHQKTTDQSIDYCELHLPVIPDRIECPLLVKEHPVVGVRDDGTIIKDENRWSCSRGETTTVQLKKLYRGLEDKLGEGDD